jgi:hypothetical protein
VYTYTFTGWTDSNNNFYSKDMELPAVISDETYTATFEATRKDFFVGHSLTLKGDIGVYFYLRVTDEEAPNTTVTFTWNGNTLENVPVAPDPNGSGYYRAACSIAVAEMTCPITAFVTVNGDKKSETDEDRGTLDFKVAPCGHSLNYTAYLDSDECMICDREFIASQF